VNVPAGGVQLSVAETSTPDIAAVQALEYVCPSHPHVGVSSLHVAGMGAQAPSVVAFPHVALATLQ
jgi:hypothetical protein